VIPSCGAIRASLNCEEDHRGVRDRARGSGRYEGAVRRVDRHGAPERRRLPEGQIFHAAGPCAEGWAISAVHDSKESWETFRDGTLLPNLQRGIPGGFTSAPQKTAFDVDTAVS